MNAGSRRRSSRVTTTIVGALVGGVLGAVVGALVIDWIDPGPPDLTMVLLISMAALGGLGWIVGAAFGWLAVRDRPPPSGIVILVLAAVAIFAVSACLTSVHQAKYGSFGPMIDDLRLRDPLRGRLALTITIDTVLAVATALVLILATLRARRRSSEEGAGSPVPGATGSAARFQP